MLGIVTGLTAEARLARPLGVAIAGGGTPAGARRAAERLAVRGATTLISFGLAGGLAPDLRPGALVIPNRVVTAQGIFLATTALAAALGGPTTDTLLATNKIIALATDKQRLYQASGAAAVDMESGEVARVAMERGLGFGVLRAVCDAASCNLPPAALVPLGPAGDIALARIILSVLRQPAQLPALMRLAGDAQHARNSLRSHIRRVADIAADPRF
jgi:adenosylhomocysteine nucleosidase